MSAKQRLHVLDVPTGITISTTYRTARPSQMNNRLCPIVTHVRANSSDKDLGLSRFPTQLRHTLSALLAQHLTVKEKERTAKHPTIIKPGLDDREDDTAVFEDGAPRDITRDRVSPGPETTGNGNRTNLGLAGEEPQEIAHHIEDTAEWEPRAGSDLVASSGGGPGEKGVLRPLHHASRDTAKADGFGGVKAGSRSRLPPGHIGLCPCSRLFIYTSCRRHKTLEYSPKGEKAGGPQTDVAWLRGKSTPFFGSSDFPSSPTQ
ncbi:hypothetical protein CMUS01_01546 [Colletotrichum musicola]|uniref:Uncharacterized protein n=1 Tax=Colletotrichum musicola TaxID=2175873 RepID=A0A8H6NWT9_9PEZI|nr:hypothetical protein CMUS01_01546 [Colletotrichum musicola]